MNSQNRMQPLHAAVLGCMAASLMVAGDRCVAQTTATQPSPVAGVLLDMEGKPLGDVEVRLAGADSQVYIKDAKFGPNTLRTLNTRTDNAGKFSFEPQANGYSIVVLTDAGYAFASKADFEKTPVLRLEKWVHVEGVAREGTKPLANARILVRYERWEMLNDSREIIDERPTTDADGKFTVNHAFAGRVQIGLEQVLGTSGTSSWQGTSWFDAKAGETIHPQIGGAGCPVISKLVVPAELRRDRMSARITITPLSERPGPVRPVKVMEMNADEFLAWRGGEEGRLFMRRQGLDASGWTFSGVRALTNDGELNFRATDVKPGKYVIEVAAAGASTPGAAPVPVSAILYKDFTVDAIPGGVTDTPLDLGTLALEKPTEPLHTGDDASAITFVSFDGKAGKVVDYRGKLLLLELWGTANRNYLPQHEALARVWDAHGKSVKIAVLGLNIDPRTADARAYLSAKAMPWPQVFGGVDAAARRSRALLAPTAESLWLVGPDGVILARNLVGDQVQSAVDAELAK